MVVRGNSEAEKKAFDCCVGLDDVVASMEE